MAKFSARKNRPNVHSPVVTRVTAPDTTTHQGGLGFSRDAKSDLFLLALSNMVGEQTFYEPGKGRDIRFRSLIHQVVKEDPDWVARFVPYLRDTMNMRSASLVMAAEYVAAGGPRGRRVVASALRRADEPAEMLAYWMAEHGRRVPKPVKRGVADAAARIYDERNALKYDGTARAWRFADVIELCHPAPATAAQERLWKYLLDQRHHGDGKLDGLPVLRANHELNQIPPEERREKMNWPTVRRLMDQAHMTWERASQWLGGSLDATFWETTIPRMGYMALLRNLRNFEEAGISRAIQQVVQARLADPAEVRKSRQFPIRFFSAWKFSESMTYGEPLEKALELSLENVPRLPGRTLILVDHSGSMFTFALSSRSKVMPAEVATVFGCALALRCEKADLVYYSWDSYKPNIGRSVLRMVESAFRWPGCGRGTNTWSVLYEHYRLDAPPDRVVIVTDEQTSMCGEPPDLGVPMYTWNLQGYGVSHAAAGEKGQYVFGGLTDAAFRQIEILESMKDSSWPF